MVPMGAAGEDHGRQRVEQGRAQRAVLEII